MVHNIEIRMTDGQANGLGLTRMVLKNDEMIAAIYTAQLNMPQSSKESMSIPKSELTAAFKRSCAHDVPVFLEYVQCLPCSIVKRYEYTSIFPDVIKRELFDRLYISSSTYGRAEVIDYVITNPTSFPTRIVELITTAKELLAAHQANRRLTKWNSN